MALCPTSNIQHRSERCGDFLYAQHQYGACKANPCSQAECLMSLNCVLSLHCIVRLDYFLLRNGELSKPAAITKCVSKHSLASLHTEFPGAQPTAISRTHTDETKGCGDDRSSDCAMPDLDGSSTSRLGAGRNLQAVLVGSDLRTVPWRPKTSPSRKSNIAQQSGSLPPFGYSASEGCCFRSVARPLVL